MPVAYRVKSLADLSETLREKAKGLREVAADLRLKRNKDRSEIEANVYEEVAAMLDSTTIEP